MSTLARSGPELRELRDALGLPARALADALRVSESRVRNIEQLVAVRPEAVARYRDAVRRAGRDRLEVVRALLEEVRP